MSPAHRYVSRADGGDVRGVRNDFDGPFDGVHWDTLVFDKRDAMVLGPLPLAAARSSERSRRSRDVSHWNALPVNVTSGLPFAFVTGGRGAHQSHFAGHLTGTIGGAVL